ncbi:hypothetical protein [Streptomyces carpaticus]|uniref:Uncharacterized protein n=1 Tax=Streptomyces carpaticus TaxID=285558 RepID=A0ABV4ZQF2_9ACTN
MSRLWRWRRLRNSVAAGVILAVLAGSLWLNAANREHERAERLAGNREAYRTACDGRLPDELLDEVGDGRGRLREYGSLTGEGESVALLHCFLSWGTGSITLHARPVLGPETSPVTISDRGLGGVRYALPGIAAGADTSWDGATAWLYAPCPNGLKNRGPESRTLSVSVEARSAHEPSALATLLLHTALRFAQDIAEELECGEPALPLPDEGSEAHEVHRAAVVPRATQRCAWLTAEGSPLDRETWRFEKDRSKTESLMSDCVARPWSDGESPLEAMPSRISAVSISPLFTSAFFLPSVPEEARFWETDDSSCRWKPDEPQCEPLWERRHMSRERSLLPDERAVDPVDLLPERPAGEPSDSEEAGLALWARSQCLGGTAHHRIALSGFRGDLTDDELYAQLSGTARQLMDRYLADAAAWPTSMGRCQDPELVREVWR